MEAETKRMTAGERESLMRVNLAMSLLLSEADSLKRRNKLIRYGNQMLAAARGLVSRYVSDCYRTIPLEQLKTIQRSIADTTYTVGVRCQATRDRNRDREYGVVVPIGALNAIFAACGEHCLMCMGSTDEQNRCPLRKALDAIPNDVQDRADGRCPYQGVLLNGLEEANKR